MRNDLKSSFSIKRPGRQRNVNLSAMKFLAETDGNKHEIDIVRDGERGVHYHVHFPGHVLQVPESALAPLGDGVTEE